MNPFFFGRSARPLFGVYTHGKSGTGPPWSVLLCYPVGSEYMRAHRAFRQLNSLLNRAGANVLRFDYSCTGDSAGNGVEATAGEWLEDIDWALDELKDNAMTDTVSVVGLRMGATLAALACAGRDDVDQLVLWDPIVSCSDYLDAAVGAPRPSRVVGVEGSPMTPELVKALDAIDLRRPDAARARTRTSILVSDEQTAYRELDVALRSDEIEATLEVVPSAGNWAQVDPFGDALIPQEIILAIVDSLRAKTAA
jgi:pimeloyl-ACP methyl ester carboxylesterase